MTQSVRVPRPLASAGLLGAAIALATSVLGLTAEPVHAVVPNKGDVYVGLDNGMVGAHGTDRIDRGGDQCTLYYTSEGSLIRRFNICTNTQMSDFAMAPSGPCYAHRVRPNGEVLLTCSTAIYRFGPAGNLLQIYPGAALNPSTQLLVSLNLDPDNSTFWTADAPSRVYRVDITTGTQVPPFSFSIPSIVGGLAVVGEPGQAPGPGPSPTPSPIP